MQDLGTLGGNRSEAYDLNNYGTVVGESKTASDETHAFIWRDGAIEDLGTLGGSFSRATGINDQGEVVGMSSTSSGENHAFIWSDGQMRDLGTLGGNWSMALAINEKGQVAGEAKVAGGAVHGALWKTRWAFEGGSSLDRPLIASGSDLDLTLRQDCPSRALRAP